ncbi:MAG: response regulator [Betaproteobacteria bacterium]
MTNIATLRILAVEDHEFQRKMLLRILAGLGATNVSVAADGNEALKIVMGPGAAIDIIISDLDMPGMDGAEFMRHLGEALLPVAIILASALGGFLLTSIETMTRDYGVRILGVIEKPLTPAKVSALIELYAPEPSVPLEVWSQVKAAPSLALKSLADGLKRQFTELSRIAQPAAPIDRLVLAALSGGDAAAEREILADFRRAIASDAAAFMQAVGAHDFALVTSTTDRIANASRIIGAMALGQATERVRRSGSLGDWGVAESRLVKFKRELARLDAYCEAEQCSSPA